MNDVKPAQGKGAFPCAMQAWNNHEQELLLWLLKETQDRQLSQDLLQEVFIRILQQQEAFCQVENARAWMFRVARNLLIDQLRKDRFQPVGDNIQEDIDETDNQYKAVDLLAISCLPRVLSELEPANRDIITACDLNGIKQQEYAQKNGLSLPATKSRLLRAREKLKKQIEKSCQVTLDEHQNVCCFTSREKNL